MARERPAYKGCPVVRRRPVRAVVLAFVEESVRVLRECLFGDLGLNVPIYRDYYERLVTRTSVLYTMGGVCQGGWRFIPK